MNKKILTHLTFFSLLPLGMMANAADQICYKSSLDQAPNVHLWQGGSEATVAWPGVFMDRQAENFFCADLDFTKVNHALFSYSGGNNKLTAELDLTNLGYSAATPCYNNGTFEAIADCNWVEPEPEPEPEPDNAQVKRLDNIGSEFYFAFMSNSWNNQASLKTELYLATNYSTTVTVQWPANSANPTFKQSYDLKPGIVKTVSLAPIDVIMHKSNDITSPSVKLGYEYDSSNYTGELGFAGIYKDNLVKVSSSDGTEFIAYQSNREGSSSDAAMGLPTDVLGMDYYLSTYVDKFDLAWQQFIAYAIEDNTEITITAAGAINLGTEELSKGQKKTITLQKGEALYGVSNNGSIENTPFVELIAGTRITSTKPIGLTSGNGELMIGSGGNEDAFEIIPAVETWGDEFVVSDLNFRANGSHYQIYTSKDATLYMDGNSLGPIKPGTPYQITTQNPIFPGEDGLQGAHVFNAKNSAGKKVGIMGMQYMTSDGATTDSAIGGAVGDPAMALMVPTAQYLDRYTFATPPKDSNGVDQYAFHGLNMVAKTADINSIKLDGKQIEGSEDAHDKIIRFVPITGTDYSYATFIIHTGTHVATGDTPFGIIMSGYNPVDSYLYPGGARFEFINQEGDDYAPLCELGKVQGYSLSITASDDSGYTEDDDLNGKQDLPAEEDDNGNDIFDLNSGIKSINLDPTSTNLMLDQSDFKPGLNVEFAVSLQDDTMVGSGKVIMVDGRGNEGICIIPEIDGDPIEAKVDEKAPTCTVNNSGGALEGSASDDIFTEDLDGNGLLNDGESDSNDNDAIDYNSGLASIELVSNSNLKIVMDEELVKGVLTATYKIVLIDVMQDGSGELVVRDVIGNESEVCNLSLDKLKDPTAPDAQAFAYAENPTDTDLTGLKSITVMQGKVVFLDSSQSSDVDNDIVERAWVIENHNNFTTSSELTPFTFTQAGTHKVTLTVTDAYGLSSTSELEVTVEEPEVIPEKPDNQLPITTVEATVDHDNDASTDPVSIEDVDYILKGAEMYATGTATDEDGKVEYYIWQLLDEDDNVIMEYQIPTTPEPIGTMVDIDGDGDLDPVGGKFKLIEYPYGKEVENPLVRYVPAHDEVTMRIDQEGYFRIALLAIDDTGAKSETTPGGSSPELANADIYVESGSAGLFSGLFLMLSLLVRRKVKA